MVRGHLSRALKKSENVLNSQRKNIPSREKSKCKGSRTGVCFATAAHSKRVAVAGKLKVSDGEE